MKKCIECGTITNNDNLRVCEKCGCSRFAVRKQKVDREINRGSSNTQNTNSKNVSNNPVRIDASNMKNIYGDSINSDNRFRDEIVEKQLSVVDWIIIIVQMAIPLWNILFILKTLINKKSNKIIKNYIKASLIIYIICIVMLVIFQNTITEVITNLLYATY